MNTHEITQPKQGPLQKAAYFYINQIYTTLDRARNTPRIEHDKVNWEKLEQRRLYNFQNHLFITKTNEIDLGISMKQIWDEVYQDLYQMVKGLELPDDEEMTDNDFTFTDIMNINNLQKAINNLPEKYPWKVKEFNDKGIDFTIIGRLNLWDFKEDCIRTNEMQQAMAELSAMLSMIQMDFEPEFAFYNRLLMDGYNPETDEITPDEETLLRIIADIHIRGRYTMNTPAYGGLFRLHRLEWVLNALFLTMKTTTWDDALDLYIRDLADEWDLDPYIGQHLRFYAKYIYMHKG